jgi:hypothetical protein
LKGGGGREDGDEAGWFDGWPGGRGDVREASLELRDSMNDSGVDMGRAIVVEDVILISQSERNGRKDKRGVWSIHVVADERERLSFSPLSC